VRAIGLSMENKGGRLNAGEGRLGWETLSHHILTFYKSPSKKS